SLQISDYQAIPRLTGAVSRKVHGSGNSHDIDLLTEEPAVECRNSNGNHTLVFTFSKDVVSGDAAVESGTGSLFGNPIFAGNTMTVNLTGVANAQAMKVQLSGVADSYAQELPDTEITARFLIGDTTNDHFVNSGDATETRSRSGHSTDTQNFRSDVNADGNINSGDAFVVRKYSGTTAP
ncbi:MAG TPA: dockerin type I domain-containing protein, partial [Chthoniobacterales bacterium]